MKTLRNDAEKKFNELVAEAMNDGWHIDCSNGWNSGSQGEEVKVVMTNGEKVKAIWVERNSSFYGRTMAKEIVYVLEKEFEEVYNRTFWLHTEEANEVYEFFWNEKTGAVISMDEIGISDEEMNKIHSDRWEAKNIAPVILSEFAKKLAINILRHSGIRGTKTCEVSDVTFFNDHYHFHLANGSHYTMSRSGIIY